MKLTVKAHCVIPVFLAMRVVQTGESQEPPQEIFARSNYVREVLQLSRHTQS